MANESFKLRAIAGDGSEQDITLVYTNNCCGRGSFGVVLEANLEESGDKVAVKTSTINRTGETSEVKYLKELNHCNIVNMMNHFRRKFGADTKEFIIMELMPATLSSLYNRGSAIPEFRIKLYVYQLLRGLAFMHARDICHRDVRPDNILIDTRTGVVKLCDFGLTKRLAAPEDPFVGARYYRAPEMILHYTNYTTAVDIWAVGCVLVELLKGGTELFCTAWNDVEQLQMMMDYFGTPDQAQFEGMMPMMNFDLPKEAARTWSEIFFLWLPVSEDAISLCSELLCYSPRSRLLAHQALTHKFFDELRLLPDKRLRNGNSLPPLFDFHPDEFPGDFNILIPSSMRCKNSAATDSVHKANENYKLQEIAAADGSEQDINLVYTNKCCGRGSFGVVLEAKLEESGDKVAVKTSTINRTGETSEVKYLKELKHCNIVNMMYHFRQKFGADTKEFIVMELMPATLSSLYNRGSAIPEFRIKLYVYQLLRGLAFMHARDICHRDVRPDNILIDTRTGVVKLCDFGLTKRLAAPEDPFVGAKYYRAPEMILHYTNYTKAVDIWAAGCVLVELLKGGTELFCTAWNDVEQLQMMMEYFGTPEQDQFEGMMPMMNFDLPKKAARTWSEIFFPWKVSEDAVSLCSELLCYSPRSRLLAHQAPTQNHFPGMEHSYPFDDLQKKEAKSWSEIVSPYPISDDAISLCSRLLCYSPRSRLRPHKALAHIFFDDLRSAESKFLTNGNPLPPLFNFQPGEFPGDVDVLIPSFMKSEHVQGSESVANDSIGEKPEVPCWCSLL